METPGSQWHLWQRVDTLPLGILSSTVQDLNLFDGNLAIDAPHVTGWTVRSSRNLGRDTKE